MTGSDDEIRQPLAEHGSINAAAKALGRDREALTGDAQFLGPVPEPSTWPPPTSTWVHRRPLPGGDHHGHQAAALLAHLPAVRRPQAPNMNVTAGWQSRRGACGQRCG